ncbi:MAG: rhomboid family intramembrane serine protease [Actinomycetota bacterium]|nr:MAG: rhomboid family intramembrane serine protease [Actinomycetota bacterium]
MIPLHDDNPTRRFPLVTLVLIALNLAVFVFQLTLPRSGLTAEGFFLRAGLVPYEIVNRVDVPPDGLVPVWATVFTSMFIHGGWLHIIFNMLYLWIFGNNVEDRMGRARFVAFYLLCGVAAAAAQVVVRPDALVPMIGASGAVSGVLGAYILLFPRAQVLTVITLVIFFPIVMVPAWVLLLAWFALNLLQAATTVGAETGVAYFAHVGGFAAGLVLVWLFARRRPRLRRRVGW